MIFKFKNLSSDLTAFVECDDGYNFEVYPKCNYEYVANGKNIVFKVKYFRDFTFGLKDLPKLNRKIRGNLQAIVFNKLITSTNNFVLQCVNTYSVSKYNENDVIELTDSSYVFPQSDLDKKIKAIPVVYYFGRAELIGADIKLVDSIALNRESFVDNYKLLYKLMNFKGVIFRIFRFFLQIHKYKTFSKHKYIVKKFKKLYGIDYTDRNQKLKPINNFLGDFVYALKNKLPKKIYDKLIIYLKSTISFNL